MEFNVESRIVEVTVYDDADKTDIIKYAVLEYLIYEQERNDGVIRQVCFTFPPPEGDFVAMSEIEDTTLKQWIAEKKSKQVFDMLEGMKDEYMFKHELMRKVEWQT